MRIASIASLQATTFKREATSTARPSSATSSVSTLPASASATSTPSASSSATSTLNSGTPSSSNDSGLSTGATAGIAVGVVAVIVALLAMGLLVWRNKRKGSKLQSTASDDNVDYYSKPQGVEVAQPYQDNVAHEAYAPVSTKYTRQADQDQSDRRGNASSPVEMDPIHPPQELQGSGVEARRP